MTGASRQCVIVQLQTLGNISISVRKHVYMQSVNEQSGIFRAQMHYLADSMRIKYIISESVGSLSS